VDCDYCGDRAVFEVSAHRPGDAMTRYVCRRHVDPAREHCRQVGDTNVYEIQHETRRVA
jgi:hypothetical protein